MPKGKLNKIYTLIEQGLEDECIALLEEYGCSKVEELQKHKSIWHLAVKNNCQSLVTFLIDKYYKNMDCLENNLSPWCLAVTLNNATIARMLSQRGANTKIRLNEQGQTLLHKAVLESDIELLNYCINCRVDSNIVDAKGYTAHFYAHVSKNMVFTKSLQKLQEAVNANPIDLYNSVTQDDSEALQALINDGVSPIIKIGVKGSLLDHALIHNSNKVMEILRAAGVERGLTDLEIIEQRRKIYSRPNPLLGTYAMEKLSLKKSEFKISPLLILAVSLFAALCTSLVASVAIAIGAGILSGLLYVSYVGKMHFSKVNEEKDLKSSYKKALDQKRVEVLKLAEQINTEKNAELLNKLAKEIKETPQPTFATTEYGYLKISGGKLLLMDKQIEKLKKIDIEVPEAARTHNRAKI